MKPIALGSCEERNRRARELSQQLCERLTAGGHFAYPKLAISVGIELRRHGRLLTRSIDGERFAEGKPRF